MKIDLSEGVWLKGILHTHSTNSDGILSPEEVVRFFRRAGYGLVSITDHNVVTRLKVHDVVYLPGIELDIGRSSAGFSYHVVIVGLKSDPPERVRSDIQSLIDWARDSGYFTFIAHPYWSMLSGEDLAGIRGYHGVEVYNTGCEVGISRGYSGFHWDYLLHRGRWTYGIAVDDAHYYTVDVLGGWIRVRVREESHEGVLEALINGDFYSSSGLEVRYLEASSDRLNLKVEGATEVRVLSGNTTGLYFNVKFLESLKKGLTWPGIYAEVWEEERGCRFRLEVKGKLRAEGRAVNGMLEEISVRGGLPLTNYARIELIGKRGTAIWTNPFKV